MSHSARLGQVGGVAPQLGQAGFERPARGAQLRARGEQSPYARADEQQHQDAQHDGPLWLREERDQERDQQHQPQGKRHQRSSRDQQGVEQAQLLLIAFVVSLFAEPHRPIVLGVLMLLFVGGSVWGLLSARSQLRAAGSSLEASLAELRRDAADLAGPR